MATSKSISALAISILILAAVGCEKTDTTVKSATEAVKETSEKVAKDVSEATRKAAKNATAKAEELAAPINAKAQEIIDSTRKLVTDGRIQEALAKWKQLAGEKLSAEQQAMANRLKAQMDRLERSPAKLPAKTE